MFDASVKQNSSAVVAATWDKKQKCARLAWHRIFQPSPEDPLDFESTIEAAVLDLRKRYRLRKVLYDPFQMHSTAQRLVKASVKMEEFSQSVPNLTEASQNLYELIKARNLVAYPDAALRLAVSRAVAVDGSRGWKIAKEKQSHKIDVVIALGMAALAAIRGQSESSYNLDALAGIDPDRSEAEQLYEIERAERAAFIVSGGTPLLLDHKEGDYT
jgi:hypothetical protein